MLYPLTATQQEIASALTLCSQVLDYAGVRRSIIYRNPPLVDDEGYEVDSEEDDDRVGAAALAAAELNPYTNIHLERR